MTKWQRKFFILIQIFHLLWTFRWRLPSFSTVDEWLAMRTGNATRCSGSWLARLFSWEFWSRRHQKFIKNVSEFILALVSVHGLEPPPSYLTDCFTFWKYTCLSQKMLLFFTFWGFKYFHSYQTWASENNHHVCILCTVSMEVAKIIKCKISILWWWWYSMKEGNACHCSLCINPYCIS